MRGKLSFVPSGSMLMLAWFLDIDLSSSMTISIFPACFASGVLPTLNFPAGKKYLTSFVYLLVPSAKVH